MRDGHGRETLRVTDAGVQVLAATLARHRAARDAHEALIGRVAVAMQRAGRIVWRGLSLRVRVGDDATGTGHWVVARPDLFSVRHTSVEDYLEPVVHEIKVRRADLLADVRRPAKGEAYRQMGRECWYVLAEGVGDAGDVPEDYGVMVERGGMLDVLRPAPAARAAAALRDLDGPRASHAGAGRGARPARIGRHGGQARSGDDAVRMSTDTARTRSRRTIRDSQAGAFR